jgi:hypothetical protein
MATERKLDLFWLLGELNKKNYELWDKLDDDQKKEISFYTLTMWLACTNDFEQLYDLGTIGASHVYRLFVFVVHDVNNNNINWGCLFNSNTYDAPIVPKSYNCSKSFVLANHMVNV